jgi:hypothetical protein
MEVSGTAMMQAVHHTGTTQYHAPAQHNAHRLIQISTSLSHEKAVTGDVDELELGGADGSGAEEVRELELTENGDEDVGLQIGPVEFGRRWFLHYAGIRFGSTPPPVPYSYPSE